MTATHVLNLPNHTSQYEDAGAIEGNWHLLFGLSLVIAIATCLGGLYSLLSLLRKSSKSSLCLIVASLSIDDMISVVPLTLFMILQWRGGDANRLGVMCTLSGLLYVFQGLSSNMKACLIVAYTFYVTKRFGVHHATNRPFGVFVAVVAVWTLSLAVSILPVCGWGGFAPSSLGCLPESDSLYVLVLFGVYLLCFCGLLFCSVPLFYQLMCSTEALRTFYPSYLEITGSAPSCDDISSHSRNSLEKIMGVYNEFTSNTYNGKDKTETCSLSYTPATSNFHIVGAQSAQHSIVFFSQKRFSMILAVARMVLWMPMMIQMLVSHAVHMHSSSLETFSFFLTWLAAAVTPVFVLSECWIHLPCGCFISCPSESTLAKKRRFEFNLSFNQGYGIYKISYIKSPSIEKPSFNSLYSSDFSKSRVSVLDSGQICNFSTVAPEDSSLHSEPLLEQKEDSQPQSSTEREGPCTVSTQVSTCNHEDLLHDNTSVFDGPERRLSHEDCRKIELTDWEWCRSKSERTPRQRSTVGLAIPLCAFQGTVSLHAPTGKTLSLSTYEVSSDGLKISPNNARKVEVYRSKSVGHEPSMDDSSCSTVGGTVGSGITDTNVKIHLEVLEICDNEEAMDSVSIVSNISQSSATHARSPSLRFSRRENRFVSCDLGETASYSLLIPSSNPDADNINIHIPDTVEAHRQNSQRQHQKTGGYQEEIQLLNEAYRRQEGDQGN